MLMLIEKSLGEIREGRPRKNYSGGIVSLEDLDGGPRAQVKLFLLSKKKNHFTQLSALDRSWYQRGAKTMSQVKALRR
jgi:hypothetical protein